MTRFVVQVSNFVRLGQFHLLQRVHLVLNVWAAGGNLPRDGLTGDGGATVVSARPMGVVDVPGSDIGGGSSHGDGGMKGEAIGIDGRPFVLDFDVESMATKEETLDGSCPILNPFGYRLASIEGETLLRLADVSEEGGRKLEYIFSNCIICSGTQSERYFFKRF